MFRRSDGEAESLIKVLWYLQNLQVCLLDIGREMDSLWGKLLFLLLFVFVLLHDRAWYCAIAKVTANGAID